MHSIDFEQIFGASPNAYMVLDRELRFVAANAAYLKATGRMGEELHGRYLFEVFPNDPADPENAPSRLVRESMERVLASGEPESIALVPYRVAPADDAAARSERYWSATHTPLRDGEGRVRFVLQHTVDVTEVKLLEDAVRRAAGFSLPPSAGLRSGVLTRAEQVQAANQALCDEQQRLHALLEQARRLPLLPAGRPTRDRAGERRLRGAGRRGTGSCWASPSGRPCRSSGARDSSSCWTRCATRASPSSGVGCGWR